MTTGTTTKSAQAAAYPLKLPHSIKNAAQRLAAIHTNSGVTKIGSCFTVPGPKLDDVDLVGQILGSVVARIGIQQHRAADLQPVAAGELLLLLDPLAIFAVARGEGGSAFLQYTIGLGAGDRSGVLEPSPDRRVRGGRHRGPGVG